MRSLILGSLMALAGANPELAAGSCAALTAKPTQVSRAGDAALVARLGKQAVTVADIGPVMVDGPWRLVWATPHDAERGVYFFRRTGKGGYRLIDIWGGVLAPGERGNGISWARKLRGGGPSARLAGCFADAVVAGK